MKAVQIVAYAGKDPEMIFFSSGKCLTKVLLRIPKKVGDEWKAMFIEAKFFNETAEKVADAVRKGCQVFVSGQLDQEEWEDKNTGAKRTKMAIIGDRCIVIKPPRVGVPADDQDQEVDADAT